MVFTFPIEEEFIIEQCGTDWVQRLSYRLFPEWLVRSPNESFRIFFVKDSSAYTINSFIINACFVIVNKQNMLFFMNNGRNNEITVIKMIFSGFLERLF